MGYQTYDADMYPEYALDSREAREHADRLYALVLAAELAPRIGTEDSIVALIRDIADAEDRLLSFTMVRLDMPAGRSEEWWAAVTLMERRWTHLINFIKAVAASHKQGAPFVLDPGMMLDISRTKAIRQMAKAYLALQGTT